MSEDGSGKWWKVKEASQRLNLSEKTVLQWIKLGKLRAKKFGKSWLIEPINMQKNVEDVGILREVIELLREELEEKNRQIAEKDRQILLLLSRKALPQGQEPKPWWKFWRR